MKRIPRSPKAQRLNSFTLVELLVVICIIAILVSVLIGAVGSALKSAKRARAYNMATGIQTAVTSYYTEYSLYPLPSSTTTDYAITDTASANTTWGALVECLNGNYNINVSPQGKASTQTTFANTRGIAFLTMRSSDVDTYDAPQNPIPSGASGYEIYFNIAMDGDYDGTIGATGALASKLPNLSGGTATYGTSTAGVAVWANCNGTTGSNPNYFVHTY